METTPDPLTDTDQSDDHIHPTVRGGLALWTLFVGLAMLMIGNGLNAAVLGVRTVEEGFGLLTTGLVMAGFFAGFLLGPIVVISLLSAVGHIRVFAGLASIASSAVLVQLVLAHPVSWTLTRFTFGFCVAGLYLVIESWLNDASTPTNRGRTLALYALVSMAGLATGQLLLATADPSGPVLFVVASLLVSLSFVPMALAATTEAPPVRVADHVGLWTLARTVPTGAVGMLLTGASHGMVLGLAAVYATGAGFSSGRTAFFVAAPALGAIALLWPIGWVSDRLPRRLVILIVATAAAAVCAVQALLPDDGPIVLVVMLAVGGLTFPLYSLLLSYTLDWSPPGTAMGASGALLRLNGAGAVVGPIVAGAVMARFGGDALFWCLVGTHGAISLFVVYRQLVAERLPLDQQGAFVPVPARASEFAIRLASRPLRASRSRLRPPATSSRDIGGNDPTGFISGRRW